MNMILFLIHHILKKTMKIKKKSEYMRLARNEANLTIEKICEISKRLLKNKGHLYLIFR